jgi:prepilin-type N-terminal cleavage/methylation domain-containing protein
MRKIPEERIPPGTAIEQRNGATGSCSQSAGVGLHNTSLGDERGFTFVELLVVLLLLAGVAAIVMSPLVTANAVTRRALNYASAQQSARTGLDSMVSQIRQATSILSSGPNSVEMNVSLGGAQLLVYYECDIAESGTQYRECVRVQTQQGGTLPPLSSGTVVATNLVNGTTSNPVFSWGPDPTAPYYMTATLVVPASDGQSGGLAHSVVLSSGGLARNLNVQN